MCGKWIQYHSKATFEQSQRLPRGSWDRSWHHVGAQGCLRHEKDTNCVLLSPSWELFEIIFPLNFLLFVQMTFVGFLTALGSLLGRFWKKKYFDDFYPAYCAIIPCKLSRTQKIALGHFFQKSCSKDKKRQIFGQFGS